jgi:DNA polymerase-4
MAKKLKATDRRENLGSLYEGAEKRYRISTVADELNHRYGQNAVYFGGIHSVLDSAPTRISFTSIPDVDDF